MAKITLSPLTSGFQTITAINTHLDSIEAEFQDKVLYRDNPTGEPNSMQQDLDMNGYNILNLGATSAVLSATGTPSITWGTQYNGSGTHSLSAGLVFRVTEVSASETATVALDTEANSGWSSGDWLSLVQRGAGKIKVSAQAGVTLRTVQTIRSSRQYAKITLSYRGGDIWYLNGELETTV